MAAVTFVVVAILSQCLSPIQAAGLVVRDVGKKCSRFAAAHNCINTIR